MWVWVAILGYPIEVRLNRNGFQHGRLPPVFHPRDSREIAVRDELPE